MSAHPILTKTVGERFSRRFLTLDETMQFVGAKWTGEPHITFDPDVDWQYRIVRGSGGDGTLLHTLQMFSEALQPLFKRESFYRADPPKDGWAPRYIVGRIRHATVFGRVILRCRPEGPPYPGLRESVTIPVRVEWVEAPGIEWAVNHEH